jgi:23S rRNA (cytosine1962-C5)-methyltransferase
MIHYGHMSLFYFNSKWDYELLDSGDSHRLERWGKYVLVRPDPQAIWQPHAKELWSKADAKFDKTWHMRTKLAQPWTIRFPLPLKPGEAKTGDWDIKLHARLTPFKHTGIFAEQAANWEWLCKQVESRKLKVESERPKVLNLFGYTGAATILLAKLGCFVTHVDASKPAITWAKENQSLNNLPSDSIRWILDDALKFVKRELKRGAQYDGILMDPPAFGHSPTGKTWKFAEDLPKLLADAVGLLSPSAKFLLINAYATNSSALALQNILEDALHIYSPPMGEMSRLRDREGSRGGGTIESGELCLRQPDNRLLSTGIVARWISQ